MAGIKSIYLIGSLRNPEVPSFANELERQGFEVFDSWFSPGPEADDFWRKYEQERGRTYAEALQGYAARHIFEFDKFHLDRCDAVVMLMPAGKSGHLELGYGLGRGKPGFMLFNEVPERWDVMLQFCTGVFFEKQKLFDALREVK